MVVKTITYTLFNAVFILPLILGAFPGNVHAQLASWPLAGSSTATTGPGITATMSLGAGVTDAGYGTHYGASGCTGRIISNWTSSTTSISAAVTANKYIEFAITPTGGQNLQISSFQFSASAGFNSNGTGSPSMAIRFSKNATFGSGTFLKHPSACSSELLYAINNSNNGSCATYTFNSSSSGACSGNPWPITVNSGETIRFRIYIGTTNNASTWRAAFRNVIINGVNPLPVALTSFSASCEEDDKVNLHWTTQTEQNSQKFIAEKSRDMNQWSFVSEIQSAGNSSHEIDYDAVDDNPAGGISYYRLVQVDNDGVEKIYGPVSVSCSNIENSLVVYPNPSKGTFTVEVLSLDEMKDAEVLLTDIAGKIVSIRPVHVIEGKTQVLFDDMDLQMGTYIVRLSSKKQQMMPVRIVINQ